MLISKQKKKDYQQLTHQDYHNYYLEDWVFQFDYAEEQLNKHFQTKSLKGFGIENLEEGIVASGTILYYLSEAQHTKLQHITKISRIAEEEYVWMDRFTIRNLELYQSNAQQGVSLLDVIDKSISPMGSRMLKRWLALPLKNLPGIKRRLNRVDYFYKEVGLRQQIQLQLRKVSDLERLISKVATQKISPREVNQLLYSIEAILPIKEALAGTSKEELNILSEQIHACELLREKISHCMHEDAPVLLQKGNVIKTGFSKELDELRSMAFSGKDYLDQVIQREIEATGISSLKIGNNNVFGYYIEVRNTHKYKVPETWIRKQTLVNAERYITEELKEYESKILGAEEKILALEQQLFQELIAWLMQYIQQVQQNASIVAEIDVLCGFAQLATEENYCLPELNDGFSIDIKEGRHPVIEKQLKEGEPYIANDVYLSPEEQQIIMITGPNMSGKSALLRQTALIVLLAQMGSFVPATAASIGVVDKLFTRVGASDNISMGESTFMVEMNETASILNNISNRSLVLLDEIGRGTSTYDGISIAWSITEYLHEHPAKAKTLFATHYHELNEMTHSFERIKNFNVSIKELKDKVLFVRKLVPGGSQHSFGIHVAKMAGMPQSVILKANKILEKLEASNRGEQVQSQLKSAQNEPQLSFFQLDDPLLEEIRDEITQLDIDTLTPVEALMKLNEIKRMLTK